jgi:hypothetical protein
MPIINLTLKLRRNPKSQKSRNYKKIIMNKKKGILVAIAFLFFTIGLSAQNSAEKVVAKQVDLFHLAMVDANEVALNDLTSEKLSYGHSNGAVEDKKDFMHKITSGASDYTKIDVSNQTINISGDVAIVRQDAELLMKGAAHGTKLNLMLVMVWQKSNGKWKLLARQGVKVA